MCNKCRSGCNSGCSKSKSCCKSEKLTYGELMATITECEDASGELLVYNEGTYCKVSLDTILGDGSVSGDSLDITGDGSIGGDLDVDGSGSFGGDLDVGGDLEVDGETTLNGDTEINGDLDVSGCVTADCLTVTGNVDFTGANITFDNGEICSEVARCVMNDASVIAAIEAVAAGAGGDFGCADVAACINSHAGTQNAIRDLMAGLTNFGANNAFANALADFIDAHLADSGCCGGGGGGSTGGLGLCAVIGGADGSVINNLPNGGGFVAAGTSLSYTVTADGGITLGGTADSPTSNGGSTTLTVCVNGTDVYTSGSISSSTSWEVELPGLVAGDIVEIKPADGDDLGVNPIEQVEFEFCGGILG